MARLLRVANGLKRKSVDTEEVSVTNQIHFLFLSFPVSCFPGSQTLEEGKSSGRWQQKQKQKAVWWRGMGGL